MDDLISRQAAIDAVKKNTFRLTFAEEQGCEGHVVWSAEAVYSDVIEGALLELPSAQPERKTGKWRHYEGYLTCSECETEYDDDIMTHCCDDVPRFCPNCGADMREGQE